jgi:hypothetical protein
METGQINQFSVINSSYVGPVKMNRPDRAAEWVFKPNYL